MKYIKFSGKYTGILYLGYIISNNHNVITIKLSDNSYNRAKILDPIRTIKEQLLTMGPLDFEHYDIKRITEDEYAALEKECLVNSVLES